MKQVYRNIVKNLPDGQLFSVAVYNAKRYNEVWYWAVNGQMAFNDKGRKGYEQFACIGCRPDGSQFAVEAAPKAA